MEQAFLLPFPQCRAPSRIPEAEPEKECQAKAKHEYWCGYLNRLANDPLLWPEMARSIKEASSPAYDLLVRYAETDKKQSLLHLAVLHDQLECISPLKLLPSMLCRRDSRGLTPLEIAQFLHKKKTIAAISEKPLSTDFHVQPNVEFERGARFDLEYLPQPIFESFDVLEEILTVSQNAKERDKIPHDRIWLGVYYDREIQRQIHPKVAIRRIDDTIGYGLFAGERIMPCTLVGEYTGVVQKRGRRHARESKYCIRYTSWPVGRQACVIDAEKMGNFTRFINHSDNPNVSLVTAYWRGLPRFIFLTLKEIPAGSQITFDYGSLFWQQSGEKRQLL